MDTYLTLEQEQKLITNIALTLGIESPYILVEGYARKGPSPMIWVVDRRKWRNFLEAVERIAEEHGRIPLQEGEGQLSFDLGNA